MNRFNFSCLFYPKKKKSVMPDKEDISQNNHFPLSLDFFSMWGQLLFEFDKRENFVVDTSKSGVVMGKKNHKNMVWFNGYFSCSFGAIREILLCKKVFIKITSFSSKDLLVIVTFFSYLLATFTPFKPYDKDITTTETSSKMNGYLESTRHGYLQHLYIMRNVKCLTESRQIRSIPFFFLFYKISTSS